MVEDQTILRIRQNEPALARHRAVAAIGAVPRRQRRDGTADDWRLQIGPDLVRCSRRHEVRQLVAKHHDDAVIGGDDGAPRRLVVGPVEPLVLQQERLRIIGAGEAEPRHVCHCVGLGRAASRDNADKRTGTVGDVKYLHSRLSRSLGEGDCTRNRSRRATGHPALPRGTTVGDLAFHLERLRRRVVEDGLVHVEDYGWRPGFGRLGQWCIGHQRIARRRLRRFERGGCGAERLLGDQRMFDRSLIVKRCIQSYRCIGVDTACVLRACRPCDRAAGDYKRSEPKADHRATPQSCVPDVDGVIARSAILTYHIARCILWLLPHVTPCGA